MRISGPAEIGPPLQYFGGISASASRGGIRSFRMESSQVEHPLDRSRRVDRESDVSDVAFSAA